MPVMTGDIDLRPPGLPRHSARGYGGGCRMSVDKTRNLSGWRKQSIQKAAHRMFSVDHVRHCGERAEYSQRR